MTIGNDSLEGLDEIVGDFSEVSVLKNQSLDKVLSNLTLLLRDLT